MSERAPPLSAAWGKATQPYWGNKTLENIYTGFLGRNSHYVDLNQPLECSTNIRLLQIMPSKRSVLKADNAPLRTLMVETPIDEAPDYYALSYVWGDAQKTQPIKWVDQILYIHQSLEKALVAIRNSNQGEAADHDRGLFVWADGLCIRQKDAQEKPQQLALMPRIYGKAKRIIVFLSETDNAKRTIDALNHCVELERAECIVHEGFYDHRKSPRRRHYDPSLFSGFTLYHVNWVYYPELLVGGLMDAVYNVLSDLKTDHARKKSRTTPRPNHTMSDADLQMFNIPGINYELLNEIFKSPWFTRSWVNQELGYAYTADFYLGKFRMRWEILRKVAMVIQDVDSEESSSRKQFAAGFLRVAKIKDLITKSPDKRLPLLQVMTLCRPCDATDPRDKIYSVMSMARQENSFPVDYISEWPLVYTRFAEHVISSEKNISIMTCCDFKPDRNEHLPTWVPDWTDRDFARQQLPSGYCAGGDSAPVVTFPSHGIMSVQAILHDEVLETSDPLKPVQKYSTMEEYNMYHTDIDMLRSAEENVFFNRAEEIAAAASKKGVYPSARNAFLRSLIGGRQMGHSLKFEGFGKEIDESVIASCWYNKRGPGRFPQRDLQGYTALGEAVMVKEMQRTAVENCIASRFFSTHRGYIGTGPMALQSGDVIAVLCGSEVPFTLRKTGSGRYRLLGFCYVDGIMKGEVFDTSKAVEKVDLCIE